MIAFAVTTTAGYGVLFYSYGVLLPAMQKDLGWSRTFLSGAFSTALLIAAAAAIPIGRRLDRHPPRPLFLLGAVTGVLGAGAWALARTRWEFIAVWALLGVCQGILFYPAAFTVLTKRFGGAARHRALTTVTLVAGLASTIFAPLTGLLEQALGWRGAVLVLAALLGATTVPAFLFGLSSRVMISPDPPPAAAEAHHHLPGRVVRTAPFWLLTTAYLLSAGVTVAVAIHLVPFLLGGGLRTELAASTLGAIGLVQVLGRGIYLRVSARVRPIHLGTLALLGKAIGLLLLLAVPGVWGVALFVLVYGSSNGATTLTQATSLAELYGPTHFGSISGLAGSVTAAGAALAPVLAAAAIDLAGREAPVFAGLALLAGVAAVLNQAVGRTGHYESV